MQRTAVVGIAVVAAALGLWGGFLLGRPAPEIAVPPDFGAARQDPDAPNAIAALAISKAGGPVVPRVGDSVMQFTLVSFTVGLPGSAAANQGAAEPCVRAAIVAAQAALAGAPQSGAAGSAGALLNTGACNDGAEALRGRLRLSARPTTPIVGRQSPGAYNCDATLRWAIAPDDTAQELRSTAYGETMAAACETASGSTLSSLLPRL